MARRDFLRFGLAAALAPVAAKAEPVCALLKTASGGGAPALPPVFAAPSGVRITDCVFYGRDGDAIGYWTARVP